MLSMILLTMGAAITILWGVAHLFPTKNVAGGFGEISADNRRILVMEWMTEGFALIFIGALMGFVTYAWGPADPHTTHIAWACAAMLISMAVLFKIEWLVLNSGGAYERDLHLFYRLYINALRACWWYY
jgi:hypothetical protein